MRNYHGLVITHYIGQSKAWEVNELALKMSYDFSKETTSLR
jgi:hypothetical protein